MPLGAKSSLPDPKRVQLFCEVVACGKNGGFWVGGEDFRWVSGGDNSLLRGSVVAVGLVVSVGSWCGSVVDTNSRWVCGGIWVSGGN